MRGRIVRWGSEQGELINKTSNIEQQQTKKRLALEGVGGAFYTHCTCEVSLYYVHSNAEQGLI